MEKKQEYEICRYFDGHLLEVECSGLSKETAIKKAKRMNVKEYINVQYEIRLAKVADIE